MSSICTKCGALLPPGVRFCTVCGAPVPAESAARPQTPEPQTPAGPALCPSCGNPLKPGVRFCTACGANLTNAEPIRPQPRQSAVHPSAAAAAGAAGFEALTQGERPEQGSPYRPSASTVRPQSASNPTVRPQSASNPTAAQPQVGPRRSTVCPKCGQTVQPGRNFCTSCGARISAGLPTAPAAHEPVEEREIRETRSRTGMWITIGTVAAVVLLLGILLLIFWDDLFGKKGDPVETVNYGEETMTQPSEQTAESTESIWPTRPTDEESEVPTSVYGETDAPTQPTESQKPTIAPTQPPTQPPKLSKEAALTIVRAQYGVTDVKVRSETSETFTVDVYRPDGDLAGTIEVNKTSGTCKVVQPLDFSEHTSEPEPEPEPSASSSEPSGETGETGEIGMSWNTDPKLGPTLACSVGSVSAAEVSDRMKSAASGANYSFTVLDIFSGESSGTETQTDKMSSSVLIGIPVLYAVSHEIEAGELTMDSVVPVVSGKSGRGSLSGRSEMKVRDLLETMLRDSSGDAICTLMDAVGKTKVNKICHDAGYASVELNNYIGETVDNAASDNYVSSYDLCRMLCELYTAGSDAAINRDYLLENFGINSGSYINDGLGKNLDGVVGSFNGVKSDKFNEIILVERNNRAYVMCLMANGVSNASILSGMNSIGSYVDGVLID